MSAFLEFLTLKFKPSLLTDPSTPPSSVTEVASTIKAVPGVAALHLGQHIEKPELFVAVIRWESEAAHEAYHSSAVSTDVHAQLKALIDAVPLVQRVAFEGDVDSVLAAPVLEICTAWGADDDFFTARGKPFSLATDAAKLAGYHGIAYGEFEQAATDDAAVIPGKATRLILGWDTKAAHMQHKDSGSAIDDNIHYLTSGRKEFEMIHVDLKKL
ncbi:hypothetical protein G7046_g5952 [Stylonectria norvegica]|nr:hypothetical protein G7046_g5952 [Stylonectria norvegica]